MKGTHVKKALLLAAVATAATFMPMTVTNAAPQTPASIQQFARCAASNYDGAELLATQPGSEEEAEVLAEFGRRSCSAPSTDAAVLRGTVAEELFKKDFVSIGSQARRESIEVFRVNASELEMLDTAARTRVDYVAFGTCVAATDSESTAALLKTKIGSADEARLVAALQPKFSPCLSEGERLSMSKAELRGALAEGAYRLALAETLDEEVIVTGARDPSKSVQCKKQDLAGTRFRRTICMTGAQWAQRDRDAEYAAANLKRQADDYNNAKTVCVTRFREGCLIE